MYLIRITSLFVLALPNCADRPQSFGATARSSISVCRPPGGKRRRNPLTKLNRLTQQGLFSKQASHYRGDVGRVWRWRSHVLQNLNLFRGRSTSYHNVNPDRQPDRRVIPRVLQLMHQPLRNRQLPRPSVRQAPARIQFACTPPLCTPEVAATPPSTCKTHHCKYIIHQV